jgi:hypothetical protein
MHGVGRPSPGGGSSGALCCVGDEDRRLRAHAGGAVRVQPGQRDGERAPRSPPTGTVLVSGGTPGGGEGTATRPLAVDSIGDEAVRRGGAGPVAFSTSTANA